ncbi:MAG: hypothetical protein E6J42_10910 [Chloroflexi bacterium]|nr:MAG: hypothetical protein E6J42_10910 [Chloroflexota bacterium]
MIADFGECLLQPLQNGLYATPGTDRAKIREAVLHRSAGLGRVATLEVDLRERAVREPQIVGIS